MRGYINNLILWIYFAYLHLMVNPVDSVAGAKMCTPGEMGRCFQDMYDRQTPWQANRTCATQGGMLASVRSQADFDLFKMYAMNYSLGPLWTGGRAADYDWTWTGLRHRHTKYLGCYGDDMTDPDLEMELEDNGGKSDLFPSECAKRCLDQNSRYRYASVQNNYGNVICRCGKTYGKHGKRSHASCQTPCPRQPPENTWDEKDRKNLDKYCGALGFQIVVRIWGLQYHSWVKPSVQTLHDCAALDHTNGYNWKDFHCSDKRLAHICEYDKSQSNCVGPSKTWLATENPGICITLHTDYKNWFQAIKDCQLRGGFLLEIRNFLVQKDIKKHLQGTGETYWIGLTRITWKWQDGSTIKYFAWEPHYPSSTGVNQRPCIQMVPPTYKWYNRGCNIPHYFLCEFNNKPNANEDTPTLYPFTPTPQLYTPTSDPPSHSPIQPSTGPDSQVQPNRRQRMKIVAIGAGVVGGVIIVIIIIIICCCCCCKKKSHQTEMTPDTSKLRTLPSSPNEKVSYDNAGMSEGEKTYKNETGKTEMGHNGGIGNQEKNYKNGLGKQEGNYEMDQGSAYIDMSDGQKPQLHNDTEDEYLALTNPDTKVPNVYEPLHPDSVIDGQYEYLDEYEIASYAGLKKGH